MRKPTNIFGFGLGPTQIALYSQRSRAGGLKFSIYVEASSEYYPSSENKGADLRLCCFICRLLVFFAGPYITFNQLNATKIISLSLCCYTEITPL